jgi:hypothetical protein
MINTCVNIRVHLNTFISTLKGDYREKVTDLHIGVNLYIFKYSVETGLSLDSNKLYWHQYVLNFRKYAYLTCH